MPTRSAWTHLALVNTTVASSWIRAGRHPRRGRGTKQRIRLTSAVTVLSAEDPVRAFQHFATLDLLSRGRAEMIVGRGSSIEAFPLFGFRLEDYDALFEEKLELLLTIASTSTCIGPEIPCAIDRARGLPAADAGSSTDLARRRWHAEIVRARRRARTAVDGGHHWRRAAPIPAADRSVSRNRPAAGALPGATEGRRPYAWLCRPDHPGGG